MNFKLTPLEKQTTKGRAQAVRLVLAMGLIIFILSLLTLSGCAAWSYNVILAINAKEYRPQMGWVDIRETGFKDTVHGLRVYDADGNPIPLYRYKHESSDFMLLDEAEIAISTPIIIERKYRVILLSVIADHKEVARVRVKIDDLQPTADSPKAGVVPLNLP